MCSEDYYDEDYTENVAQEYDEGGSLLSNTCAGKKLFCLKRGEGVVGGQAIKLYLSLCTEY